MFKKLMAHITIKNKILIPLMVGITVFSIIISFFTTYVASNIIENNMFNYLKSMQHEVGNSIELTLDQIFLYATSLIANNDVNDVLTDKKLTDVVKQKKINELIAATGINSDLLSQILFVTNAGEVYSYTTYDNTLLTYDNLLINTSKTSQTVASWGSIIKDTNDNNYLQLGIKMYDSNTFHQSGYMIFMIDEQAFRDIYQKIIPNDSYSFLLSNDNYVISHIDSEYVGSKVFDVNLYNSKSNNYSNIDFNNENSILAVEDFSKRLMQYECNWKIVSIIPYNALFSDLRNIKLYIFLITFFMIILASLLSIKLSKTLSLSIISLNQKIQLYMKNGISKLPSLKKNEVVELETAYDEMITRINKLIIKNNEEKEKQRDLELHALQSQINPHFLYNTLDAIAWIAKLKKQKDIESLVLALAQFFRISLHKGDKYITVEEEIDLARSYIAIEKIRFPDKIAFEVNVDEDILDLVILKLTLQPFIENAIKHGVSKKVGLGTITLNGYLSGSDIIFEIIDDGVGCDDINNFYKQTHTNSSSGYGISNVQERITLDYGEDYGIHITSKKGEGTKITINLDAQITIE